MCLLRCRTRQSPGLLGVSSSFCSWTRESIRASTVQHSAVFSYALLKNGSLARAARCLASYAAVPQMHRTRRVREGGFAMVGAARGIRLRRSVRDDLADEPF